MYAYLPAQVNEAMLSLSRSCMALDPLAFKVLTASPPLEFGYWTTRSKRVQGCCLGACRIIRSLILLDEFSSYEVEAMRS